MAKLILLDEAAAQLGISIEELKELRTRNEIFGYRDGSSWKFKESEIERLGEKLEDLKASMASSDIAVPPTKGPGSSSSSVDDDLEEMVSVEDLELDSDAEMELDLDLTTDEPDAGDSVLISEEELGPGKTGSPSTIIAPGASGPDDDLSLGEAAEPDSSGDLAGVSTDADTVIAAEAKAPVLDDDSDISLEEPAQSLEEGATGDLLMEEDIDLDSGTDISLEMGSDPALGQSTPAPPEDTGSEIRLAAESGIDLELEDSTTSASKTGGGLSVTGGSEIDLDGSELTLESISGSGAGASASKTGAGLSEEDDILLDMDDDFAGSAVLDLDDSLSLESAMSDLSLSGSSIDLDSASGTGGSFGDDDSGSDVTLGAGDSGINLASPSDTGISLEVPPSELSGSGFDALELGEAELLTDDDDELADFGDATDLKADDDFLLTPTAADGQEDSDESGSQVIALDEDFEEEGSTLLGDGAIMDDDSPAPADEPGDLAAPAATGVYQAAEAPYSVMNVASLSLVTLILAMTGMMMMDLLRNIWSWDQPYQLNSAMMDFILSLFGQSR